MKFDVYTLRVPSSNHLFQIRRSTTMPPLYPCPVCGYLFSTPAWGNSAIETGAGKTELAEDGYASDDICPICSTQYGCDDMLPGEDRWKPLRLSWLMRRGWNASDVQQLENLGYAAEQVLSWKKDLEGKERL